MPKPDALDCAVTALLTIGLFVVAPMLVGRAMTPHIDGKPVLLNATILAEQRYVEAIRAALSLCTDVHAQLQDLPPAEQAFSASGELQKWVDATDRTWAELDETEPPGRFSALSEQTLALVKLYRYLAGEAWAYYGDLDDRHLLDVERGLAEAGKERARLEKLVDALDFGSAPVRRASKGDDSRGPVPAPGWSLPEWGSAP
jgi:hypothetical protein